MIPAPLRARLRSARRLVFLTGAGLSADSGIPTFRGEEGYWTVGSRNYRPTELARWDAFRAFPEAVWGWYLMRRAVCRAAEPNAGHRALVELERRLGDRFLCVTQNVDGLHRRAGTSTGRLYEIHGDIDWMRCSVACTSERWPVPLEPRRDPPTPDQLALLRCPRCGEQSRPHVLWFDECYDEETYRFESSRRAAAEADVLVTLGTSGATNLPLQMGRLASASGALLLDVNPEHNPFADLAEASGGAWLPLPASAALQAMLHVVEEMPG